MRRSPETLVKAAPGDTLTAVLGLCALMFTPVASAGATGLCDTRTIDPPDLDIQASDLKVELIDLSAPASIDIDISVDADARMPPSPPDMDVMLKRLFDLSDDADRVGAHRISPAARSPLAELSRPVIRTETPVTVTEDAVDDSDTEVAPPAVSTRMPGLSEDELRRYRSKMYRTDI